MPDEILRIALEILDLSDEPLETKEILARINSRLKKDTTRTILFYRLNLLRGEGKIKGKFAGPGKGVWIWWRGSAFVRGKDDK